MKTDGLRLDQAPPLWIPASFFLLAPASMLAGGTLLILQENSLSSSWIPATIALTHLGTLGFLVPIMLGALYQMLPVIGGAPVPAIRLAHVVWLLLCAGLACFVLGMLGVPGAMFTAISLLGVAFAVFLIPVGIALKRAPTHNPTVSGMRQALSFLLITIVLGLWIAHGHAGMNFPGPRNTWLVVHLTVALLGWVGGLLSAVSWQVLPMFYLGQPVPRPATDWVRRLIALGCLLPTGSLVLLHLGLIEEGSAFWLARLLALPAGVAVWLGHPWLTLRSISRRRRKRHDASLRYWQVGLGMGPLLLIGAVVGSLVTDPRPALLFGWWAIWGWAGIILHGMLTRIVAFLVWFHRFSHLVGLVKVPSMQALWPRRRAEIGLGLHLATLALGTAAVVLQWTPLTAATGVSMILTGIVLGGSLLSTLTAPKASQATTPG